MPKNDAMRILLLEDDYTLSSIVEEFLTGLGYDVQCAYDGNSAVDMAYEKRFDLYLLDVKVPYTNGFDVLRQIRQHNTTSPAVFITSLHGIEDLSSAYAAGCDDYMRKPFELKELALRISVLLKRSSISLSEQPIRIREGVMFHPKTSELEFPGSIVSLSPKEALLLEQFLTRPNDILSSTTLIEAAWDFDEEASEQSLRTHIKNLRKHLGKETLVNIRGRGYRIALS